MPSNTSSTPNKLRGKPITIDEFAALIDVTPDRVKQYIRQGMPVFEQGGRGKAHVLSSYDCIWWMIEAEKRNRAGVLPSNPDTPNEKQEINRAKLAMAQLELAKRQGTLFDFTEYLPYIKDKMVAFRQAMSTVVINVREKFGGDVAKFVDKEITSAINAYHRGLENIPNEVKE